MLTYLLRCYKIKLKFEDFGLLESTRWTNAIRILDILIQKGADVNVQNTEGYTPLYLSREYRGDSNCAEAFLLRGSINNFTQRTKRNFRFTSLLK